MEFTRQMLAEGKRVVDARKAAQKAEQERLEDALKTAQKRLKDIEEMQVLYMTKCDGDITKDFTEAMCKEYLTKTTQVGLYMNAHLCKHTLLTRCTG